MDVSTNSLQSKVKRKPYSRSMTNETSLKWLTVPIFLKWQGMAMWQIMTNG